MSSGPSTPTSLNSIQYTFKPFNSSPLASPSPSRSSPLVSSSLNLNQNSTSERRRLQFKSQNSISSLSRSSTLPSSSSPLTSRHTPSSRTRSISSPSSGSNNNTTTTTTASSKQITRPHFSHPEDPQKQFLRERIKAKCIERAQKARARAVKQRRYTGYSDRSSDGFEMDEEEDEEENDDDIMSDELFRRIMAQTNRKTEHTYRLSYAQEVGSSFDPDMEDVEEWEHEVQDPSPVDWDDEELEAYAEECARQATLDDLAGIPEEELFNLDDIDDVLNEPPNVVEEMDLS